MRTVAEQYAYYFEHPLPVRQPLAPVKSDATTQVIPYTDWIGLKCGCCGRHGVSGVWMCRFTNHEQLMLMCAACAFYDAFAKWTGFFSRRIVRIDLVSTLTYPSRT